EVVLHRVARAFDRAQARLLVRLALPYVLQQRRVEAGLRIRLRVRVRALRLRIGRCLADAGEGAADRGVPRLMGEILLLRSREARLRRGEVRGHGTERAGLDSELAVQGVQLDL